MRYLLWICMLLGCAQAADHGVLVQSTTSTANSGLYDHLLPLIHRDIGLTVRVVAVGTGQAIHNAERCDGDILLVHARAAEEAFVAAGYGIDRHDLMFNDFVIVGPDDDPAGVGQASNAAEALQAIAVKQSLFVSRGDDSGTHSAERALWAQSGVDPLPFSGEWYRATGSGMGATLNAAAGMDAYTLSDRATWISFGNKGALRVLLDGDPALFNQYGVIAVNPDHCPFAAVEDARQLIAWLLSSTGQRAIADFRISGEQVFFPNARH